MDRDLSSILVQLVQLVQSMVQKRGKNIKVGRISIDIRNGSTIRLRWSHKSHENGESKRYTISLGAYNPQNWQMAIATAQRIDSDITMGDFDSSLSCYRPDDSPQVNFETIPSTEVKFPLISTVWERYQFENRDFVSYSQQVKRWRLFSNLLKKLDFSPLCTTKDIHRMIDQGRSYYSSSSLFSMNEALSACLNWAEKQGYSVDNPCLSIRKKLRKSIVKKLPDCFESWEIQIILTAFRENYFHSEKSQFPISFYYHYVHFLALSGFRPEEAIALTWKDFIIKRESAWIRVDKTFTLGRLNHRTKTGEVRAFPINHQMKSLIDSIPKRNSNLVFPSRRGGYINHNNFARRIWKPIISRLDQEDFISQYLSLYHLRHTFITNLIREGYDIATVAKLAGNSPKVIIDSYLSAMSETSIPEFNF